MFSVCERVSSRDGHTDGMNSDWKENAMVSQRRRVAIWLSSFYSQFGNGRLMCQFALEWPLIWFKIMIIIMWENESGCFSAQFNPMTYDKRLIEENLSINWHSILSIDSRFQPETGQCSLCLLSATIPSRNRKTHFNILWKWSIYKMIYLLVFSIEIDKVWHLASALTA